MCLPPLLILMKRILITLLLLGASLSKAEPWVDTRDDWLRADIELLASQGIINHPITTWPLPWAPIIKDLEAASRTKLSENILPVFLRVKRKARLETSTESYKYLSLMAGNQSKLLRHFGDVRREKAEISSRITGMSKSFAWNIEATKSFDPLDGEEQRFDHSYVAAIWGNWIITAGAQERWYGPGWDTSLLLSNNARPIPSVSLQRNYSDAFETPWLSWLGPWSLNAFAGQLESDRFIPHAKLLGISVTLKPFESLEIGFRRTAQWGGEGRPETLSSLVDLAIGRTNCDQIEDGCDDRLGGDEAGNQLAGIDFSLRLPTDNYWGSIYGQLIGEDEAGYAPSRKLYQLGYKTNFYISDFSVTAYLEYADTENEYSRNLTYEHGIYRTGYRAEGRSIGSTYDNDTQSLGLGFLATHKNGDRYKLRIASIDLNNDGTGNHTITESGISFTQVELKYQHPTRYGLLGIELDVKDKLIDTFGYQQDKYNIGISWTMEL